MKRFWFFLLVSFSFSYSSSPQESTTPLAEQATSLGIIIWPEPIFPKEALNQGISGKCLVRFNLLSDGNPIDIIAECTDEAFCESATAAVHGARFDATKITTGELQSTNLVYPLSFLLDDTNEDRIASLPVNTCVADRNIS